MKTILTIEGRRNGYAPEQCGKTMTVGELIEFLQTRCDEDMPVYLSNDNGYTYGNIDWMSFEEVDREDDEEEDEEDEEDG